MLVCSTDGGQVDASAPGGRDAPPLDLDEEALEVSERARRFAEDVLMPLEEEAERRGGRLPEDVVADLKRRAMDARLQGSMHAVEQGGQGWTRLQWALVEEQYGRTTNALHWLVPNAYNVWAHASPSRSTGTCDRRCAAS